jgi:hypothetical protein
MSSVDEQSAHNNATSTLAAAEESEDDTSARIQYQDKEQEEDGDGAASRDSNSDDVDSDSDDCKKSDSPDSDEEEESEGEGTGDDEGSALVPLNIGPGVFAPRTDAFPLPSLGDEESWVWEPAPNSIIQTMTDFTLAHQQQLRRFGLLLVLFLGCAHIMHGMLGAIITRSSSRTTTSTKHEWGRTLSNTRKAHGDL